jgi:hypothetical protein
MFLTIDSECNQVKLEDIYEQRYVDEGTLIE